MKRERQSEARARGAGGNQCKRRADLPGEELADGQAKTAASGATGASGFEKPELDFCGDAGALVAHGDADRGAGVSENHADISLGPRGVKGVLYEIIGDETQ